MMRLEFHTMDRRPDLGLDVRQWYAKAWPTFLLHGQAAANGRFERIMQDYSEFQTYAYDAEKNIVLGFSQTAPLEWSGNIMDLPAGWDGAVYHLDQAMGRGDAMNTLCALAATVNPEAQGLGLASILLQCKKDLARRHGFRWLIAPVRPSHKHLYPTIPLVKYVDWRHDKSELAFDPWIRTHQRCGGQIAKVDEFGMDVAADLDQWKKWSGLSFQSSGSFVIPKGNDLLHADCARNHGFYREGCVWVVYDL